jgi:hypothetical protein
VDWFVDQAMRCEELGGPGVREESTINKEPINEFDH